LKKLSVRFGDMVLKSSHEIELIRTAGRVVAAALQLVRGLAAPGVTTKELDEAAEKYILDTGCLPAFKKGLAGSHSGQL